MTLPVLGFVPEKSGYQPSRAPSTLRVGFGGLGHYRKIPQQAPAIAVQWVLSGEDYERFMVFYNLTIDRGATPFQVDLILDSPHPETKTVQFIPGSLAIDAVSGDAYSLSASLRIKQ